jgi:hypothetical protein
MGMRLRYKDPAADGRTLHGSPALPRILPYSAAIPSMPLDEATRRLTHALAQELTRLIDRGRARDERGDEVHFDSVSRMATWETRRGDVIGRWYADVIASYSATDRIFRWAWAGRTTLSTVSHADAIAQEGQTRAVPQLAMSIVVDVDESDAITLARLGVLVARGEGLEVHRHDGELRFIGLFDSARPRTGTPEPSRFSVPPPPVKPASNPPRRTLTPPATERRIREPARALFVPVANAGLRTLAQAVPGFQQALFVLSIVRDVDAAGVEHTRRLVVILVAVDASGVLRALDPSTELIEAGARLVEADRLDGNGPWRKLSARITPKADGGATLHVDVT